MGGARHGLLHALDRGLGVLEVVVADVELHGLKRFPLGGGLVDVLLHAVVVAEDEPQRVDLRRHHGRQDRPVGGPVGLGRGPDRVPVAAALRLGRLPGRRVPGCLFKHLRKTRLDARLQLLDKLLREGSRVPLYRGLEESAHHLADAVAAAFDGRPHGPAADALQHLLDALQQLEEAGVEEVHHGWHLGLLVQPQRVPCPLHHRAAELLDPSHHGGLEDLLDVEQRHRRRPVEGVEQLLPDVDIARIKQRSVQGVDSVLQCLDGSRVVEGLARGRAEGPERPLQLRRDLAVADVRAVRGDVDDADARPRQRPLHPQLVLAHLHVTDKPGDVGRVPRVLGQIAREALHSPLTHQ
mmetsp:Transcript_8501/g.20401  ORF Transcript_8501/g.20401 Transcript_8501/m.20401 type:complete len:353 (+) Transcript_8501:2051-3109(+)